MSFQKDICPECFKRGYDGTKCASCGYTEDDSKKNVLALPRGTVLKNRYLIGRVLGSGGFGITYVCLDTTANVRCAIKEYVPLDLCRRNGNLSLVPLSDTKTGLYRHGRERFLEEAGVLYKLNHVEGVVSIQDCFQQNNTAYFVMELLEGQTLKQMMRKRDGKLPLVMGQEIICRVADTMRIVHEQAGIFHRDMSPENIMVTVHNQIKVLDFGSAKHLMLYSARDQMYSVVLKPGFAPPEQYSSKGNQGGFTDVYSLAGTFYYCVTGEMIPVAMDRLAGKSYVPLKLMNVGVDAKLSDAVDQALALDYRKRLQTMQEFYDVLSEKDAGHKLAAYKMTAHNSINQRKAKWLFWKQSGDKTHLDSADVRKEAAKPQMTPAGGKITFLAGAMKGKVYCIPADSWIKIGRNNKNNIVIEGHPDISGEHCAIKYDSNKQLYFVKDTSTYGTFFQGKRLSAEVCYSMRRGTVLALVSQRCQMKVGE